MIWIQLASIGWFAKLNYFLTIISSTLACVALHAMHTNEHYLLTFETNVNKNWRSEILM
jgi:hypothetical protein